MRKERYSMFAVTAPGLEPLVRAELAALGIRAVAEPGGVSWRGPRAELYAANLRLRSASRVLVRLAEFRARAFHELERRAREVPWERFAGSGRPVRLRVTSRRSKLYHEGAIAERLAGAIEAAAGASPAAAAAPSGDEEEDSPGDEEAQLLVVRFLHDRCTISVDASGAPLHRRGYRQALGRAPLRETLAAAMLLAAGWPGDAPLLDPLCGAGTIPIEAALLGRRIAPGLAGGEPRRYAFEAWPEHSAAAWDDVVARAREDILPAAPAPVLGSDRDAGAVAAARANAGRAGVAADVELSVRALTAVEPPAGPGWLVTNPPYGRRVGDAHALRDLYAALGNLARARLVGWTVALLSADRRLSGQARLALDERSRTRNGPIPVRILVGTVS